MVHVDVVRYRCELRYTVQARVLTDGTQAMARRSRAFGQYALRFVCGGGGGGGVCSLGYDPRPTPSLLRVGTKLSPLLVVSLL
jgi:hypothetical protein